MPVCLLWCAAVAKLVVSAMAEGDVPYSHTIELVKKCQVILDRGTILHSKHYGAAATLLDFAGVAYGICQGDLVAVSGNHILGFPYQSDSLYGRLVRSEPYTGEDCVEHKVQTAFFHPYEIIVSLVAPDAEVCVLLIYSERSVTMGIYNHCLHMELMYGFSHFIND